MHRLVSARNGLIASTLLACVSIAASCTVDTKDLVYQDATTGGTDSGGLGGEGNGNGNGNGNSPGLGGDGGAISLGCEHGSLSCDGKQVEICAGGEWYPAGAACDFACVSGLCVGSCDPGSTQCISSTSEQTCSEVGVWGDDEECEFACVDGACGGECKPGVMGCDEAMPQRCDDSGSWVDEREDPCPTTCSEGKCDSCSELGETQCYSDTQQQVCDGAEWGSPGDCDFVCFGGGCTGVCQPGTTQCDSSTHKQVCGANGEWGAPAACGDQACVKGECVGVCKPGATRCDKDGTTIQLCNEEGQWENSEACKDEKPVCATSGSSAFCAVCQPGEQRCSNASVQVCGKDGVWDTPLRPCELACYQGACVTEKDTRFCKENPSARGCNSETTAWACFEGTVKTGTCPKGETCTNGSCGGKSTGTGGKFSL